MKRALPTGLLCLCSVALGAAGTMLATHHAAAPVAGLLVLAACATLAWQSYLRRRRPMADALYRTAFVQTPAAQLIWDSDGRLCATTAELDRWLTPERSEPPGERTVAALPADWQGHFARRLSETTDRWQDQIAWRPADGPSRTISLRTEGLHVAGQPVRWLTSLSECPDDTAPATLQHQAVRSKAFVQRLIDVIQQPVFLRDTVGRYLQVNHAFATLIGLERSAIIGRTLTELIPEEALRGELADGGAPLRPGHTTVKEMVLHNSRNAGGERHVIVARSGCEDADGQALIVGAIFDVTRWRVAEQDLHAALVREVKRRQRFQQYLQRLIDVIPHPVYVKDAKHRFILVNDAHAKDVGLSKEQLVGRLSVVNANAPEGQAALAEDRQVLDGAFVLKEEFKHHAQAGDDRYRVVAKGSCLDAEGEPVIVCAIFDVTEWRRAEARWMQAKEAADKANESKSQFLANMSHELRTPMHAILSFARLGFARTQDHPERRKECNYFERIISSGERLLRLLNDLLDLSKLEAGYALGELRAFDPAPRIREVLAELAAMLDNHGLTTTLDCQHSGLARGDADLLEQVVRNLMSNAIKFSPRGGIIALRLSDTTLSAATHSKEIAAVELSVSDQGPGIPEDELDAVFDKFIQSSKTHNGAGGTGLGLAICREVVQAHQGQIFARNLPLGGAEFVVRIPAASSDPETLTGSPESAAPSSDA